MASFIVFGHLGQIEVSEEKFSGFSHLFAVKTRPTPAGAPNPSDQSNPKPGLPSDTVSEVDQIKVRDLGCVTSDEAREEDSAERGEQTRGAAEARARRR